MNKADLVNAVANDSGLSKVEATRVLEGFVNAASDELTDGGKITLVGFGTFSVVVRAARVARNPRTNQEIDIPAKKVVKFKASQVLTDSLN